jgi:arabinogalactan oligomer/maltooligosaccharide transport system substrate-binding protein
MKKMRFVLTTALLPALAVLTVVSTMASCNKSGAAVKTVGGGVEGPLTIWLDNDDWAKAAIEGFNTKYPNVQVHYENVGSVDTRGKVSLDGPAGIGPDIFIMPHDHMGNAVIDGICEPIPADLRAHYQTVILDASLQTCTAEGELFAIPISTENIAFFYNKDLLGDTPVPTSFEEIKAFADTYNNAQTNKYALRWQVDDSYHNYFFLTAFGMSVFGPSRDDYKRPGFDSDAARQGVEFHHSLRQYFNVNVADTTWDNTVGAFQRGEVPFTITGPWAIGDAKKNGVNFGVAKIPTMGGNQPRCFSGNIVVAVSSYSNNPDAAFAFADYLASVEGETILFETTGKLPAYKDVSSIPGLRDDAYLMGIMEQAPYADPMPIIPEVNQMWDSLKALFTFTWDNQLSVAEAQKKAMDTYDTALMMAGKSR